jgi:hypothetical protein
MQNCVASVTNYFLTIVTIFVVFVIFLQSYFVFVSIIDFRTVTLHKICLEFTMSAVGFITVFACNLDFFFIYAEGHSNTVQ